MSTPEERMLQPLRWDPGDPSAEDMEQFEKVLKVATESGIVSGDGASKILRILKTNPCARISRLGQRLTRMEETIEDFKNMDGRLVSILEDLRSQHTFLANMSDANPNWKDSDELTKLESGKDTIGPLGWIPKEETTNASAPKDLATDPSMSELPDASDIPEVGGSDS